MFRVAFGIKRRQLVSSTLQASAEPAKYVPALGGDCMVAFAQMGRRVPGNIRHASYYGGRLLLFSNADAHQTFRAEPAKYANADLAYGGNCAVCRGGLQRNVPGKPHSGDCCVYCSFADVDCPAQQMEASE